MPVLTSAQKTWLLARESGDPAIVLLTLVNPAWGAPVRLARNLEDVVSRGQTYRAMLFDVRPPGDGPDQPRGSLAVPNIDRDVGLKADTAIGPIDVTIEVVSAAAPDAPVYSASRLQMRGLRPTALSVSGELALRDYTTETYGGKRVIPKFFPAHFLRTL